MQNHMLGHQCTHASAFTLLAHGQLYKKVKSTTVDIPINIILQTYKHAQSGNTQSGNA